MPPDWELFDRKSRPSAKLPLVTLQGSGTFSMNEASYNAVGRPAFVELLFDKKAQIIGFRPAGEKSAHAYPIKPQQNGRTHQTGGRAFCAYYGIETGKARRFAAEMIDGVLAIDLKGPARATGRVSKPRAEPKAKKGSAENNEIIELRVASA